MRSNAHGEREYVTKSIFRLLIRIFSYFLVSFWSNEMNYPFENLKQASSVSWLVGLFVLFTNVHSKISCMLCYNHYFY